ncbi:8-amino-7-oxononanoate synthase [Gemmatimonas sp.]|uniref:8-amino-7-oxononanoate synthase n=1 Tax=Gemmatimonas sp. TaxID=1962908 RepID=UPI003983B347
MSSLMVDPTAPSDAAETRGMDAALDEELQALQSAGLRRTLRQVHQRRVGTVLLDGERVADFASNDYLGLAADPRLARAANAVLQAEGVGAGAARLISGNHPIHEVLERALARFKGCEHALLFPSGYMANIGAIPALVGPGDAIYSDALSHASLIDGCRLSKATIRVFPHADIHALAAMLEADRQAFRRALIVVEGIFSMDGDLFPLDQLVPLARRFDAWTYVDDAHGTGVLGASGAGSVEHFGMTGQIDVIVGTLGKAMGTSGAYVAGSQVLVDYLTSRARSFIFTTGAPAAIAAATLESLRIVQVESWRREAVRERAIRLRERLRAAGREAPGMRDGHIIPIMVGDPMRTMRLVAEMRRRGFLLGGVRPPTVPAGTSRLRISVSAVHPIELVDNLAANLIDTMRGMPG